MVTGPGVDGYHSPGTQLCPCNDICGRELTVHEITTGLSQSISTAPAPPRPPAGGGKSNTLFPDWDCGTDATAVANSIKSNSRAIAITITAAEKEAD